MTTTPGPRRPLTHAELAVAGLAAFGVAGVTVPAFIELYRTVTSVAAPYIPGAWVVVVSGEVAWIVTYLLSILLTMRRARGTIATAGLQLVLAAGSFVLNIYAGHGILPSIAAHVVVVVAFFGTMLVVKIVVGRLAHGDQRPDRLTTGEWIAHPVQSARLWRRMTGWGETSKATARLRYAVELYATALAQADPRIGRSIGWRRNLPVTLAYQLRSGHWPADVETAFTAPAGTWQTTVSGHVSAQLSLLGSLHPDSTPADTSGGSSHDTASGSTGGSTGGSQKAPRRGTPAAAGDWPSSRGIPHADLLARTRRALTRWEKQHPGERLPYAKLPEVLRLRMSRETAKALIDEARADQPPKLTRVG